MTKEELQELRPGDRVWLCDIVQAGSRERLRRATLAELEYLEPGLLPGRHEFKVVQKKSGSFKLGDRVISGVYFGSSRVYKTYEEAKEEWNRVILDALDYNQSRYKIILHLL